MPSYRVSIKSSAEKEMEKLPEYDHKKISDKITRLGENPRPLGCVKLHGTENYRIRVGNYRILYTIDDSPSFSVMVYSVGHRREVCR